jgi:hypothetical protein
MLKIQICGIIHRHLDGPAFVLVAAYQGSKSMKRRGDALGVNVSDGSFADSIAINVGPVSNLRD